MARGDTSVDEARYAPQVRTPQAPLRIFTFQIHRANIAIWTLSMTLRIATRQFPSPITAVSRWSMLIFERRHKHAVEQGRITSAMVDFHAAPQLKWAVAKTGGSRHPVGAGKLSAIEPSPAD